MDVPLALQEIESSTMFDSSSELVIALVITALSGAYK